MYNITTSDKRDENRGASNPVYNAPMSKYPDSGDAFGKHILSLAIQPGNNTDDDNDGVVDKKGVKANNGCPEVKVEVKPEFH